ncbi:MAG: L-aspartate oxidase [Bradymonadia bacterium]
MRDTDILVIGSGIAGLSCALECAAFAEVVLVTKRDLSEANTRYAQGGISAVMGQDDSFESHLHDTLEAGAGLCKPHVVEHCVREGPAAVQRLVEWGVHFDGENGAFDLGREGGHSHRRVLHAGDITGAEIERALVESVRTNSRITILENHHAVDLLTSRKHLQRPNNHCLGAYVLDVHTKDVTTIRAGVTVLATGGAGKVYRYTSNPDVATGDGLAMGYRAGARVANLEFFQFHPTCLFHPKANSFLISEALRGEGGVLKRLDGSEFMNNYHRLGSLAPRDIVARAIDSELKKTGDKHVYLDMSSKSIDFLRKRFPNIIGHCEALGVDLSTGLIPVVPAAHYHCGGILTDMNANTSVDGLLAIGEVACTGLHGANRLASNSLLEGAVFANRAAQTARRLLGAVSEQRCDLPKWSDVHVRSADEAVVIAQNWNEIRHLMWNYVGIVRSDRRLARARRRIEILQEEIHEYYWNYRVTPDLLELRNLALVAELVIRSAQYRKESRGLHYNIDYPNRGDDTSAVDTILQGH